MVEGGVAPDQRLTRGRRLYRGVFFGLLVGFIGASMTVIPALFVQAVFTGNTLSCEQEQEADLRVYGEVRTACGDELGNDPTWLPPALIAGGGLAGLLGGFGYGFISPRRAESQKSWLPF